ncbi:hypothetical protein ElyMa_001247800 [Elysia marginata]|uniref:Uncharacterized protein n=1 Tax=Elysia marginata TaxID=1093978 RepID=A0AAV4IBU2_9GAST|nr:hypothetical protein ElyMa_001247800 [Elysia marginata]
MVAFCDMVCFFEWQGGGCRSSLRGKYRDSLSINRIIARWNSLSDNLANAPTLNSFESLLDIARLPVSLTPALNKDRSGTRAKLSSQRQPRAVTQGDQRTGHKTIRRQSISDIFT